MEQNEGQKEGRKRMDREEMARGKGTADLVPRENLGTSEQIGCATLQSVFFEERYEHGLSLTVEGRLLDE